MKIASATAVGTPTPTTTLRPTKSSSGWFPYPGTNRVVVAPDDVVVANDSNSKDDKSPRRRPIVPLLSLEDATANRPRGAGGTNKRTDVGRGGSGRRRASGRVGGGGGAGVPTSVRSMIYLWSLVLASFRSALTTTLAMAQQEQQQQLELELVEVPPPPDVGLLDDMDRTRGIMIQAAEDVMTEADIIITAATSLEEAEAVESTSTTTRTTTISGGGTAALRGGGTGVGVEDVGHKDSRTGTTKNVPDKWIMDGRSYIVDNGDNTGSGGADGMKTKSTSTMTTAHVDASSSLLSHGVGGGDSDVDEGQSVADAEMRALEMVDVEMVDVSIDVEEDQDHEEDHDPEEGVMFTTRRSLKATCAPINCVPDLHFASVAQARADPENQFYDEDDSVCKASFGTVIILAGLQACQTAIASIKFQWKNPNGVVYNWQERFWPYTLFSDTYPTVFGTRVLGTGTHEVTASVLRSNGCVAVRVTFRFTIRAQTCPAGTDKVKTRAPTPLPTKFPTKSPTKVPTRPPTKSPTRSPTKSPTRPPTKSPTQPPTTEQDAAFCKSLLYFRGHLYGANTTFNSWDGHNEYLKSMPRCCGGKLPHLATLNSVEEAFMLDWLNRFGGWIGLRSPETSGVVVGPPAWTTGEAARVFQDFRPVNPGQDCFTLSNKGLYVFDCGQTLQAFYEYDCDEVVSGANESYPATLPDGEFCKDLLYYNGHLYQMRVVYADNADASLPLQDLINPYVYFDSPCCGGKWPHLVTIGDKGENRFVQQLRLQLQVATGNNAAVDRYNILLGLFDAQKEGVFEWRNGENVSYANWEFLPDQRKYDPLLQDGYDCVLMKPDGTWRTTLCDYLPGIRPNAILEWDCEVPIPQPRNTLPPFPDPLPTSPPTKRPTNPPTKKPVTPPKPSLSPIVTQYPTLQPRSAFCKSLTYHNGHLYGYDATPRSWDNAGTVLGGYEKCCNGKAAHLVTISDEAENGAVQRLASAATNDRIWIGLRSTAPLLSTWVTNESYGFSAWCYNCIGGLLPNGCTAVTMYDPYISGVVGRWEEADCGTVLPMVFEYDCDEVKDGPIVAPKTTLPPAAAPTFCSSLTFHNGHLYGRFYNKFVTPLTFADFMEPFVQPALGIEECCGQKAHLATYESLGELQVIAGLSGPCLHVGLNDIQTEGVFNWFGSNVPVRFPFLDYKNEVPGIVWNPLGAPPSANDCACLNSYAPSFEFFTRAPCRSAQGILFEYDCDTTDYCNTNFALFGGHYYSVRKTTGTFHRSFLDAEVAEFPCCGGVPPKLVSIESAAENAFVASLLPDGVEAWMGLHDLRVEGRYEWGIPAHPISIFDASAPSLTNASYSNWAVGEPDDGGPSYYATEDCISIVGGTGQWHDRNCNDPKWYIIEFDCPP